MAPQKTIVVTGASKGLGLSITKSLLDQGHNVVGISRTCSGSLQELIESKNQFRWIECDIGNTQELNDTLASQLDSTMEIQGLVNNAAVAYDDLATNLDMSQLETMFRVNVFGAMAVTRFCIRRMLLHRTAGSLVHVSSISTKTGYKGLSMYAASKAAMEGFSKNLAREWGSLGIRSNCVVPGFMETEMTSTLDKDQRDKIYRRSALRKPTDIESVSSMVRFLLSPESKSVTGQNIVVDSGSF